MADDRIETGACFCGAVAAETRGEPFWICYDHDDDCRRALGGALIVWVGYRPAQVRFSRGRPKSFSRTKGIERAFCSICGTSISYAETVSSTNCISLWASSIIQNAFHRRPRPMSRRSCPGLTSPTISLAKMVAPACVIRSRAIQEFADVEAAAAVATKDVRGRPIP